MVGWKGGVEELDTMETAWLGFLGQVLASQGTVLTWRPGQDVAGSLLVSTHAGMGRKFCSSILPESADETQNANRKYRNIPAELDCCREGATAFCP